MTIIYKYQSLINNINYYKKDPVTLLWLSKNPGAIHFLEITNDINPIGFSQNPNAIYLLEHNIDIINWYHLSANPNAIQLLEKNSNKIIWRCYQKIQMQFIY